MSAGRRFRRDDADRHVSRPQVVRSTTGTIRLGNSTQALHLSAAHLCSPPSRAHLSRAPQTRVPTESETPTPRYLLVSAPAATLSPSSPPTLLHLPLVPSARHAAPPARRRRHQPLLRAASRTAARRWDAALEKWGPPRTTTGDVGGRPTRPGSSRSSSSHNT